MTNIRRDWETTQNTTNQLLCHHKDLLRATSNHLYLSKANQLTSAYVITTSCSSRMPSTSSYHKNSFTKVKRGLPWRVNNYMSWLRVIQKSQFRRKGSFLISATVLIILSLWVERMMTSSRVSTVLHYWETKTNKCHWSSRWWLLYCALSVHS
jgi:hypothetical protein